MATGHSNHVTKQMGEFLIAAELCRTGYITTTFTGNVPHYDLVAMDSKGDKILVQVKTINGGSWQFSNVRTFVDVIIRGKRQIIGNKKKPPLPGIIYVFVLKAAKYGSDRFFVLSWDQLQKEIINNYKKHIDSHGGVRPKKYDSFHMALKPSELKEYERECVEISALEVHRLTID